MEHDLTAVESVRNDVESMEAEDLSFRKNKAPLTWTRRTERRRQRGHPLSMFTWHVRSGAHRPQDVHVGCDIAGSVTLVNGSPAAIRAGSRERPGGLRGCGAAAGVNSFCKKPLKLTLS